ncbi:SecY-interacting protein [Dickeya dianthicola]|uniref:SecY-interacting protein n=1 Tax=Dickeya dianthicola TaxID=204039 RepID=UPI00041EFBBB|nr:SecY-interacting protein [Dickeya dianthicola]MBT1487718.1 SecY-interacting protein [Dickeya dianthicola]MZG45333.1 SecY-interacting protein [Dickeya dianthicola]MZI00011.1 SecY-interacting protein [Dickeya dianthicola]
MELQVSQALNAFTERYVELWQRETGHPPASDELYGVASPCIVATQDNQVHWLPQAPIVPVRLDGVERALEIQLHPDAYAFFTSQFAGDMTARFECLECTLLQAWSDDDFIRLQENLIGHLLTQKRLKLSPTLFLATTDSEMALISLCNLSGNVVLEEFGTRQRRILSSDLSDFLYKLLPSIP